MVKERGITQPILMGVIGVAVIGSVAAWLSNTQARLSGVVYDKFSQPVSGVVVTLDNASVTTDNDGAYSFSMMQFGSAIKTLTASKVGYYTVEGSITIQSGATIEFNIPMVETPLHQAELVLHLAFMEGAGLTTMDMSGYGNDGSLGGGDSDKAPEWTTLDTGERCLLFTLGKYLYCGVDPSIISITGDFTFRARVVKTEVGGDASILSTRYGKNDYTKPYELGIWMDKPLIALGQGISGVAAYGPVGLISLNTIHDIVATVEGNNIKLYLDKNLVASETFAGTRQTGVGLFIGCGVQYSGGEGITRRFPGYILDVWMWKDVAFSAAEILSL